MARSSAPEAPAEKAYRWNFAILAADSAAFGFLRGFLSPYVVLPFFLARMNAPTSAVAALPVLFVLGFYTCQAALMGYTQSLPRKKPLLFALNALQRAGVVGLYAASRFLRAGGSDATAGVGAVLVAYGVYAVAGGLLTPAWAEVVSSSIHRNRGRFFSIARCLGGVLTFTLGARLSRLLTGAGCQQNLVTLFGGLALFAVGTLPLAGLFTEICDGAPLQSSGSSGPRLRGSRPARPSVADAIGHVLRDRRFRRYLVARCAQIVAEAAHPMVTVYASSAFIGLASRMGLMNNVYMAAEIAGSIAAGLLGDRFGYRAVLAASSFAGTSAMSLIGLGGGEACMPLAFAMLGVAVSMSITGAIGIIMEYSAGSSVSLYFGASNLVISPFLVCAPAVASMIATRTSFLTLFRLSIGAYLVACLLLVRLPRPGTAEKGGVSACSSPSWAYSGGTKGRAGSATNCRRMSTRS